MQKAITGLQIEILSTQCKYKFEQGMKDQEIKGVIKGLKDEGKTEIATLVEQTNIRKQNSIA